VVPAWKRRIFRRDVVSGRPAAFATSSPRERRKSCPLPNALGEMIDFKRRRTALDSDDFYFPASVPPPGGHAGARERGLRPAGSLVRARGVDELMEKILSRLCQEVGEPASSRVLPLDFFNGEYTCSSRT